MNPIYPLSPFFSTFFSFLLFLFKSIQNQSQSQNQVRRHLPPSHPHLIPIPIRLFHINHSFGIFRPPSTVHRPPSTVHRAGRQAGIHSAIQPCSHTAKHTTIQPAIQPFSHSAIQPANKAKTKTKKTNENENGNENENENGLID